MTDVKRPRVALLSVSFGEYCIRLANALAKDADVLLLLPERIAQDEAGKLKSAVQLFAFKNPRLRQPFRQIQLMRAIIRAINQFKPDVVHYQGFHPWFDLLLGFWRRYPLVYTVHDFKAHPGDKLTMKTPFWLEMFARKRATQIIVHSQHVAELLRQALGNNNGLVTNMPHIQIGQNFGASVAQEDDNLILFFGRIWEYKGLEYLIRAEPLISARVPDVRIMIAGRGEDFARYRKMMAHPDRFIVHNEFISDERAAEYFCRSSIVVLPYVEASQSGVIPLAYSAGKPVVATRVGGLPEMVEDGETGYLIPPRDETQLADAIVRLLLNRTLRRQMGAKGKRKLEVECSPEIISRRTLAVYRQAIAMAHQPQPLQTKSTSASAPENQNESRAGVDQEVA